MGRKVALTAELVKKVNHASKKLDALCGRDPGSRTKEREVLIRSLRDSILRARERGKGWPSILSALEEEGIVISRSGLQRMLDRFDAEDEAKSKRTSPFLFKRVEQPAQEEAAV